MTNTVDVTDVVLFWALLSLFFLHRNIVANHDLCSQTRVLSDVSVCKSALTTFYGHHKMFYFSAPTTKLCLVLHDALGRKHARVGCGCGVRDGGGQQAFASVNKLTIIFFNKICKVIHKVRGVAKIVMYIKVYAAYIC